MSGPYQAAKAGNQSDLDRFACVCLHTSKTGEIDWDAAAVDYDPKVKAASFRTVTLKAITKVKKAAENGGDVVVAPTKGKRKAAVEEDEAPEAAEKPERARKAPAGGRKKKAAAAVEDGEDDDDAVKGEEDEA